jgi:AraC family transcriptional regulator, regulatory protein of adaptative response / DNA-3-methyladenine glycosylase II
MPLDHASCYAALLARDRRFDGAFFTAVHTTGIYCRPVCPARTPKAQNVTFYVHAAAAENAGFRPCLRCRPELAPRADLRLAPMDTPGQLARTAAARMDADPAQSVQHLARYLGVSARHLQRIFVAEFGVTAAVYARSQQLGLAKQLLTETRAPLAQVAFAAGFSSVRRFNQVLLECYGLAPGKIRRAGASASATAAITLKLGVRGDYDWAGQLDFFAARAVPGVESIDANCYRRTLELEGVTGWIKVGFEAANHTLDLTVSSSLHSKLPAIVAMVRRAFDLNADSDTIVQALRPHLTHCITGLRLPGTLNPFETAVRAILGQQISVRAATTLAARLAKAYGTPFDATGAPAGLTTLSVSPQRYAALATDDLVALGVLRARARAIIELANAVMDGRVDFNASSATLATALCSLPGIGRWTANYLVMRARNDPDACLADDLLLHRAFEAAQQRRLKPSESRALLAALRPWRSYAALQIWRGAQFQ